MTILCEKCGSENHLEAEECIDGDFYKHKKLKARKAFYKFRKNRVKAGFEAPTWAQYCKWNYIYDV